MEFKQYALRGLKNDCIGILSNDNGLEKEFGRWRHQENLRFDCLDGTQSSAKSRCPRWGRARSQQATRGEAEEDEKVSEGETELRRPGSPLPNLLPRTHTFSSLRSCGLGKCALAS